MSRIIQFNYRKKIPKHLKTVTHIMVINQTLNKKFIAPAACNPTSEENIQEPVNQTIRFITSSRCL